MSLDEYKYLFRNVMHGKHQTLAECKLDDHLAHLYATDYDSYKRTVMDLADGNALVHVR